MELDFDELFKTTLLAMKLNRCHPYITRDKKWVMEFITMHGTFTAVIYLLSYSIYHDFTINDFFAACRNGCIFIIYSVVTFQYAIMLYYQPTIIDIIEIIKKDYSRIDHLPVDEQLIVSNYARKGQWVCKQWTVISIIGCSIFPIKNICLYMYNYINGDFKLIPFYELTYPNIIEDNKNVPSVYVLIYIVLLFCDIYSAIMYIAFAPLGPVFMLHACGQLELVKKHLEDVFDGSEMEVVEKLKNVAIQLQHIYSFVDRIKECSRVMYELTLKATTIVLPITCYEVIESIHRGEVSLEFITFIIGAVLISSSPCFYSDYLMEKGEEVRLAVYSCGWERRHDRSARSSVLLILQRTLRPVAIRTMFRTVCLDALTDLFQQSYAIFNLMNTMWE